MGRNSDRAQNCSTHGMDYVSLGCATYPVRNGSEIFLPARQREKYASAQEVKVRAIFVECLFLKASIRWRSFLWRNGYALSCVLHDLIGLVFCVDSRAVIFS